MFLYISQKATYALLTLIHGKRLVKLMVVK